MSDGCSDMMREYRAGVLAPDNSAMRPMMPHNACMGCVMEDLQTDYCYSCIRYKGDRIDGWKAKK